MPSPRSRRRSLLFLTGLLILAFGFAAGCKKKAPAGDPIDAADTWQAKLDTLANTLPADASSALFVIDFSTALASYQGLRARISAYMSDYASIEADLRNTLGIDPSRPQSLTNIGIDPLGGAVCSVVQNQPLCGAMLADGPTFTAHFSRVLQSQPFNLRAPLVQTELPGGGTLLRFSSEDSAELKAAIVQTDTMGYVILRPRTESIEGLAASLETPPAKPLRTLPAFQSLLAHTEQEAIIGWLSPLASSAAVRAVTRLGNRIPSMDNIEGVLVGVKLSADAIHGWFSVQIDPNDARVRAMLTRKEGLEAVDFSKLVTDDAYLLLRARSEPTSLMETLRATFATEVVDTAEETVVDALGADNVEARLTEVLGSDMLIVATRARLLTLASIARGGNLDARALGDGLGLIMAYQLDDPEGAAKLLADIARERPQSLNSTTDDEGLTLWTVTAGPGASTTIFIMDGLLVAATSRQLEDATSLMRADLAPTLREISAPEGRALRTETEDIGIFIDLKRIANNAIGQIAGGSLSPSMRDAIQIFDEFWMRAKLTDEEWLDGNYRIQLSTPARL